jgi:putative transposase
MRKKDSPLLWIREGATITNDGREYVIVALADINLVLAKEIGSNEKVLLKIGDLEASQENMRTGITSI